MEGNKMSHDNVVQLVPRAALCLIPGGKPDTVSKSRMRGARRETWRKAEWKLQFFRKLLDLADSAHCAFRNGIVEAKPYACLQDSREQILDGLRAAQAAQMRTPPPDKAALEWKRHNAQNVWWMEKDEIANLIAADERWLKDHPTKRTGGRKAVQS
jgi:hypothetical protein